MADDKKPLSPELQAWEEMVKKDNARELLEKAAEALRMAQAKPSSSPTAKSKEEEQREKIAAWEKARSEAPKESKVTKERNDTQEISYQPISAPRELTHKEKSEVKKWEKDAKNLARAEVKHESRSRSASAPSKLEGTNDIPSITDIRNGADKKKRSSESQIKAARKKAVKAEISVRERSKSDPTPTTTKLESSSRSIRSESLESARSPRQGGITKGLKGILDRVKDGLNAQKTTYVDRTSSKHNKPNQGRF